MQLSQNAQVLDAVVRMVVPMRREFGCSVDVQAFMRDASYAQQVLGQALTSQVQRLRRYAEVAQGHLWSLQAAAAVPTLVVAPVAKSPPVGRAELHGFDAQRREAVQHLLKLVGPVAEPLCIKMERARTPDELAPLLKLAQQVVANQRGSQVANEYMASVGRRETTTF